MKMFIALALWLGFGLMFTIYYYMRDDKIEKSSNAGEAIIFIWALGPLGFFGIIGEMLAKRYINKHKIDNVRLSPCMNMDTCIHECVGCHSGCNAYSPEDFKSNIPVATGKQHTTSTLPAQKPSKI